MEIPDIIVVNKSDHPLTDTMVREIKGVLTLAPQGSWPVPIVKTEAHRGEGIEELAAKIAEHRAHVEAEGTLSERRRRNLMNEVLGLATVRLRRALEATLRGGPRGPRAARRGRRAAARPGQRGERDPRPRGDRGRRRRAARPAGGGRRRVGGPDAQANGTSSGGSRSRSGCRRASASSASCARRAPGCARTRWSASAPRCSRSPAATGSPTCSREQHVVLDPSRVAAQVASGIGFIGGGLIFVRRTPCAGSRRRPASGSRPRSGSPRAPGSPCWPPRPRSPTSSSRSCFPAVAGRLPRPRWRRGERPGHLRRRARRAARGDRPLHAARASRWPTSARAGWSPTAARSRVRLELHGTGELDAARRRRSASSTACWP